MIKLAEFMMKAEEKLTQRHHETVQAKADLRQAFEELQASQNLLLTERINKAIFAQKDVEEEALLLSKNVNNLYQRSIKWKSEQKRLQQSLEGLDHFEEWAKSVEGDLQQIVSNIEYVCSVIEKEKDQESIPNGPPNNLAITTINGSSNIPTPSTTATIKSSAVEETTENKVKPPKMDTHELQKLQQSMK